MAGERGAGGGPACPPRARLVLSGLGGFASGGCGCAAIENGARPCDPKACPGTGVCRPASRRPSFSMAVTAILASRRLVDQIRSLTQWTSARCWPLLEANEPRPASSRTTGSPSVDEATAGAGYHVCAPRNKQPLAVSASLSRAPVLCQLLQDGDGAVPAHPRLAPCTTPRSHAKEEAGAGTSPLTTRSSKEPRRTGGHIGRHCELPLALLHDLFEARH